MFDKSIIGQSGKPFRVEVERGKIHELALAIGDPNPIYHSQEAAQAAGYDDVPMPPTVGTMFGFWNDGASGLLLIDAGVDIARALHGEEEYEYLAPIHPGDVLTGVTTILDGKERPGSHGASMTIITTETRYTNQHGQPVLNARHVAVIR